MSITQSLVSFPDQAAIDTKAQVTIRASSKVESQVASMDEAELADLLVAPDFDGGGAMEETGRTLRGGRFASQPT